MIPPKPGPAASETSKSSTPAPAATPVPETSIPAGPPSVTSDAKASDRAKVMTAMIAPPVNQLASKASNNDTPAPAATPVVGTSIPTYPPRVTSGAKAAHRARVMTDMWGELDRAAKPKQPPVTQTSEVRERISLMELNARLDAAWKKSPTYKALEKGAGGMEKSPPASPFRDKDSPKTRKPLSPRGAFSPPSPQEIAPPISPRSPREIASPISPYVVPKKKVVLPPLVLPGTSAAAESPRPVPLSPASGNARTRASSKRIRPDQEILREKGLARDVALQELEVRIAHQPVEKLFTKECMPKLWLDEFHEATQEIFANVTQLFESPLFHNEMDFARLAEQCSLAATQLFGSVTAGETESIANSFEPAARAMLGEIVEEVAHRANQLRMKKSKHADPAPDHIPLVIANLIAATVTRDLPERYRATVHGFLVEAMGLTADIDQNLRSLATVFKERGAPFRHALQVEGFTRRRQLRIRRHSLLDNTGDKYHKVLEPICKPPKQGMDASGTGDMVVDPTLPLAFQRELAGRKTEVSKVVNGVESPILNTTQLPEFATAAQRQTVAHLCCQNLMSGFTTELSVSGFYRDANGASVYPALQPRARYTIVCEPNQPVRIKLKAVAYTDKVGTKPGAGFNYLLGLTGRCELNVKVAVDDQGNAVLEEAIVDTRNLNYLAISLASQNSSSSSREPTPRNNI
ncbi:MAG: hypothetical protein JWP36_493 [Paucimonas sp.]|nr:hypothetical protein [Paucimonas sp.]